MPDLYLIAHKVSGEPAFDVAIRMECPECHGNCKDGRDPNGYTCVECDCFGYWWIIPTSGHRAYPYSCMGLFINGNATEVWYEELSPVPEGLPDHYTLTASPAETRSKLEALLDRLPPPAPLKRRF
jgi:hypothetical protein